MSVLESIRKRTGLLVGLVGLAIILFILQLSLGSGYTGSIFGGGQENQVGSINGNNIDVRVFMDRVNIVSEYDRVVRSPTFEFKLPSVVSLKTYIKPARYPAFTRFNVFLRDSFECQYCGDDNDLNLAIGHAEAAVAAAVAVGLLGAGMYPQSLNRWRT